MPARLRPERGNIESLDLRFVELIIPVIGMSLAPKSTVPRSPVGFSAAADRLIVSLERQNAPCGIH